jgi:hypothetical protein
MSCISLYNLSLKIKSKEQWMKNLNIMKYWMNFFLYETNITYTLDEILLHGFMYFSI